MFRNWFVVGGLLLLFGAAAVLGFGAIFRAKSVAARIEAAAAGVLAAAMMMVGLGWAPLAVVPLGVVIGVVFVSFAVRIVFQGKGSGETGRLSAIYGALVAALSAWVRFPHRAEPDPRRIIQGTNWAPSLLTSWARCSCSSRPQGGC